MAAVAAFPCSTARRLTATARRLTATATSTARPWLLRPTRCSATSSSLPASSESDASETAPSPPDTPTPPAAAAPRPFFPKRGQTLELVCESLAFKGKGVCKAADTGFVLMCDRALPGERFLGRVSKKKGTYAEVTKLRTLSPHRDLVEAPCEYASDCGGCKTQNLLYKAQVAAKEQQVRDLVVHVGRFPDQGVLKPIVPCELQFHYRNKMEFSFGTQRWRQKDELTGELSGDEGGYALGLHAPGFFDKVLHVDKCLLQSQVANELFKIVGRIQI